MSALIVLVMMFGMMIVGMIIWSDIQNPSNSKKFWGCSLMIISTILCVILPIVRDKEVIRNRDNKLIKEAMGETEYIIKNSDNGIFEIWTPQGSVFAEVKPKITANKPEEIEKKEGK